MPEYFASGIVYKLYYVIEYLFVTTKRFIANLS